MSSKDTRARPKAASMSRLTRATLSIASSRAAAGGQLSRSCDIPTSPATPPRFPGSCSRKLRLDPVKEEFIGDDEANSLRSLPSRKVL